MALTLPGAGEASEAPRPCNRLAAATRNDARHCLDCRAGPVASATIENAVADCLLDPKISRRIDQAPDWPQGRDLMTGWRSPREGRRRP